MIINQVVSGSGGGGSSVSEPYLEFEVGESGILVGSTTTNHIINLTGATVLRDYALYYAYFSNTNISGNVNFGSLENLGSRSLAYTFSGASNITGFDLSNLTIVTGANAMFECFKGTAIVTGRFPSLAVINQQNVLYGGFEQCTSLQSLWFYALNTNSFGSRTNQFYIMLNGCTNVTVHFPMAIQSTIGSWSDVTNGFGGTNTTVLFDIVTSLTGADSNTYTRSEKDSTSTATAWTYNDTLYYTSGVSNNTAGVNEPSVADTIYSDDACTTSVTTITAIA